MGRKKIHEILENQAVWCYYLLMQKPWKNVSGARKIWHCSESMGQRWSGCL